MITDIRVVSQWSRRKDRYIGRLCSDTGSVSGGFGHIAEYRVVTGTPRGVYWAYWALVVEEEGRPGQPRAPSPSSPNWTRRGGGAPLFPSPPLSLPSLLLLQQGKGGVLLPVGVGLPPWRALLLGRPPPPSSFIYGGKGAPHRHNN